MINHHPVLSPAGSGVVVVDGATPGAPGATGMVGLPGNDGSGMPGRTVPGATIPGLIPAEDELPPGHARGVLAWKL